MAHEASTGRSAATGGAPVQRLSGGRAVHFDAQAGQVGAARLAGLWAGLLLVAVTFVAYTPVLRAGFIWDDDEHVYENVCLRSAAGLWRIWSDPHALPQYYPLVHTSFWLEYHLWGLAPAGYHVVNVLLHAAGALLLWRVLLRLPWFGSSSGAAPVLSAAWVTAALFALHPVQVESVAWVTERTNVLAGVFSFAAALAYLRFVAARALPARHAWRWYAAALVFFLCALLSKTASCTLPVTLAVLLWWRHGRLRRADMYRLIPLVVLAAALALQTIWIERGQVGATGGVWALTPLERVLRAGCAVWFYAGKLAWPHPLAFEYPRWHITAQAWPQYIPALALLGTVAVLWLLRRRIGRGPVAGVLCYLVALFPALGFFNIYLMRFQSAADHFQYFATPPLLALGVATVTCGLTALGSRQRRRNVLITALLLAICAALTARQARTYQDPETLWRATLATNPDAFFAHNALALLLDQQGHPDQAIEHDRRATEIAPDFVEANVNLANLFRAQNRPAEAREQFRRALQNEPSYEPAYVELAGFLREQGDLAGAAEHLQRAVALAPWDVQAHVNLGWVYRAQHRPAAAIEQLEAALRLSPHAWPARLNLALAYADQGRTAEAIECLQRVLAEVPGEPEARAALEALLAGRSPASQPPQ